MSSSTLVTGISGFAGSHLVKVLANREPAARIAGVDLVPPSAAAAAGGAGAVRVEHHVGEITDFELMRHVIADVRPDRIFHLAALTFGQPASPNDQRFLDVNVQGTRVLLEAVVASGLEPRIQIASSSAVYGAASENPITEDAPLRPQTLYAASKASQELVASTYHRTHGLDIVITRAFNHTGPGEHPHFATSTFARQIAEAEAGEGKVGKAVMRVGNLDSYRDFTDVRDVVRAYLAVIERGESGGVYNVCSGAAHRIGDVLDMLIGMTRVPLAVERDPTRLAPSDVPYQRGSNERLTGATGWRPAIPLATTLSDLLDYWRSQRGAEKLASGGTKRDG